MTVVRVRRQKQEWHSFAIEDAITVADALDLINREPVTTDGERVPPIAWASSCSFPICGGCAMLIERRALLACQTRLDEVADRRGVVRLEPLEKFPVRKDLWVDLGRMWTDRQRLRAYVDEVERARHRDLRRALQRCTACSICLEACPEVRLGAPFLGPAAIGAAYEADLAAPSDRARALMQRGGIDDCGLAENCIAACPEGVPLDDAIAGSFATVTRTLLRRLFRRG
jgi:succinate dehydrogenase / fumarate reductase iron-sulfur subunit